MITRSIGIYGVLIVTRLFINTDGQCPWKNGALPTVPNGYRSNVANLKLYSDDTADGYYYIKCDPGFSLDSDTGGRITCLDSGSWSLPLPKCKSKGTCAITQLLEFVKTADGIRVDGTKNFVFTNGIDDNLALGGSNVTLECYDGYKNVGGPLTIVCTDSNTWTPFPQCISTSTRITTVAPIRCPVTDEIWNFQNGYISKADGLLIYSDNTAKGSVIVSCQSGYIIDSTSQGLFSCNNGIWSSRPFCIKTGRCSLSILKDFVNDPGRSRGLKVSAQRIYANEDEDGSVLMGSFVLFTCNNGFTNDNGNLNVTCNNDNQWSSFPKCVPLDGSAGSGQCQLQNNSLPVVANSYRSNVGNLKVFSDGLATGYFEIQCHPGYTLETQNNNRITCLETGLWSEPLPQCKSMGSCRLSDLIDFIRTADGIQTDSAANFIFTNGIDDNFAIGGSNMSVKCRDGFSLISGDLTIICTSSNTWTPFPQCVFNSVSSTRSTQSTVGSASLRCPYNDDTWKFANGYVSNSTNLLLFSDKTAKGWAIVSCTLGYIIDSTSQGSLTCNQGNWSPRPYCTETARCSLNEIQNFVSNPDLTRGLSITSQNVTSNPDEDEDVLIGSSVSFQCRNGYSNLDGHLKVSCDDNGQWTPFPVCILNPTSLPSSTQTRI